MNRDLTLTTEFCAKVLDNWTSRERIIVVEHLIRLYDKPEEYTIEKGVATLDELANTVLQIRDELMAMKD